MTYPASFHVAHSAIAMILVLWQCPGGVVDVQTIDGRELIDKENEVRPGRYLQRLMQHTLGARGNGSVAILTRGSKVGSRKIMTSGPSSEQ